MIVIVSSSGDTFFRTPRLAMSAYTRALACGDGETLLEYFYFEQYGDIPWANGLQRRRRAHRAILLGLTGSILVRARPEGDY